MDDYAIRFTVDGREVSQEEIRAEERRRYNAAFDLLVEDGVDFRNGGKAYSLDALHALSLHEATDLLARTKEDLGRENILRVMAEDLKKGEALWRGIAGKSPARENLQAQYVEVEADGIEISQFLMVNMGLAKANNLDLPSRMNPEHYYFDATPNGEQIIVETFGEYRYPTYLHLYPIGGDDTWFPAELDADTMLAMTGETRLAVDDTDTKIIGMHQFKPKEGGLKVKLGVFLPEAAPSEIL